MAFSDLSAQDKLTNIELDLEVRAFMLSWRRTMKLGKTAILSRNTISKAGIDALQQSDTLGSNTNLASTSLVTRSEVETWLTQAQAMLDAFDNEFVRQQHVKFVGSVNIDGQNSGII